MASSIISKLILLFQGQSGNNSQQVVPVVPNSTLRFNSKGDGVSDPIMSELDTFSAMPVTVTNSTTTNDTIASILSANRNFLLTGTSNAFSIRDANKGGMWIYTSGIAEQSILQPLTSSRFYVRIADRSTPVWECRAAVGQITGLFASLGLGANADDPDASNLGANGAVFFFDPGGVVNTGLPEASRNNWILVTTAAGSTTYQDSGIVVVRSQDYTFRIEFDSSRRPTFYIDGEQVGNAGPAVGNVDLKAFAGTESTAVASTSIQLRYMFCGRSF